MKGNSDAGYICETWNLSAEDAQKFYAGRCAVALDGDGRLLAVVYFGRFRTLAGLRAALASMGAECPAAVFIR